MRRKDPLDNWSMTPPKPRDDGDVFTSARQIINEARLVLPAGLPQPDFESGDTIRQRRRVLAEFLGEHGVPVPEFVPVVYGWADCYDGRLSNPNREPGADGRTHA